MSTAPSHLSAPGGGYPPAYAQVVHSSVRDRFNRRGGGGVGGRLGDDHRLDLATDVAWAYPELTRTPPTGILIYFTNHDSREFNNIQFP
jgi:hypothetical protein